MTFPASTKYEPTPIIAHQVVGGSWTMPSLGRIFKHRGNRFVIVLPGNVRLYADKNHRTFYSRQHCEWTLHQIHAEIENGTFDPTFYAKKQKSIHAFESYCLEWLNNQEKRLGRKELSPTYMREVRRYCHRYFIPAFGTLNIREIRGRHLKSFYLGLEGISQKTIVNIMAVLKKLFRDALEEEVIQALPNFSRVTTPPEPETVWADESQQNEIFAHLDPETFYFIYFLATHGCRPSEARALKHSDIDVNRDVVIIRRAFSGTELRPFTKTKRVGVVPLDETWKALYLERPRNIDPEAFVFQRKGKPFSMTWASKKWREAADKAGYPNISLYQGTRHSIASQAINRGVPLYDVSKFLRYSNTRMSEKYSHLNTSGLKKVQRLASVSPIAAKRAFRGEGK